MLDPHYALLPGHGALSSSALCYMVAYLSHGAEHSLHLHSSLGSWNLALLQNLRWKSCTAILFTTCRSWFPSISGWSSFPSCRNPPRCPSSYRSVLGVRLYKPSSLAALERFLGPRRRKFLSPVLTPISTGCVEIPLALFSGIWPSFFSTKGPTKTK